MNTTTTSMEESLPPGFRFHPTDEELVTYYLSNKIADRGFTCRAIAVADLNKCEPWDLPALASMGEKEWYFYNLKDRKYPTGLRTNRATQAGYWKTTGKDKEIYRGGNIVGMKKTLVFYRGRAPKGEKSNWVMHEYRPQAKPTFKSNKDEWVVCRVFKKSSSVAKKPCQSPSSSQQYAALNESPTRTSTKFDDSIEMPPENDDVSNGLDNSHLNTSNRYYKCGNGGTIDQTGNSAMRPQNLYNTSNMKINNNNNTNQSLQWNTYSGPSFSNSSLQNSSNVAFNSLLLKALQLRNTYSQPAYFTNPTLMTSSDYSPVFDNIPTQHVSRNNASSAYGMGFNADMVATAAASSSSSQQQLHGMPEESQEQQAFSLDSIW